MKKRACTKIKMTGKNEAAFFFSRLNLTRVLSPFVYIAAAERNETGVVASFAEGLSIQNPCATHANHDHVPKMT